MQIRAILFVALCLFGTGQLLSTPEDDYYWAGVVEFDYKNKNSDSPEAYTEKSLDKYKEIIYSKDADPVDIIVFPEYGISSGETSSFVPDPRERITPCNNLEYTKSLRDLSCMARDRQKYLVVNHAEKAMCPFPGDTRLCAPDELYHFNTNVVFDRQGMVIARYRKYNLFGEAGMNVTVLPDLTVFDTDFGVRFGTFICFDLMFEQPALELVRNGVRDFVYPTMWFSELPFLTAVQIQQAWAYANDVNFLASGSNLPEIGSTGTGVFAGKQGRIVSVMNHIGEQKLYVAKVPKRDRPTATVEKQPPHKFTPSQMSTLKLKRDQIDSYATADIPLESNDNYKVTLCQNLLCCNFTLDYTVTKPSSGQPYYRYKVAVSDVKRTFDGFADGQITSCAIFACSGDGMDRCAVRFEDPSRVVPAVRFNRIEIDGDFPGGDDVFLVPNNVDTSILPLDVEEIEYEKADINRDGKNFKSIQYRLVTPRSDLLTFAIWGRKFVISRALNPTPSFISTSLRDEF
ncbi:vanin-like protein 1 [Uranotaenia lowii]|uniref:vanin-like protein 1 n=1 Tax=Uranotaenia lowii TaxID=190385 RepID=UPI00247A443F|nr:vanin-like protein 1 [Uranotaenia lowii]